MKYAHNNWYKKWGQGITAAKGSGMAAVWIRRDDVPPKETSVKPDLIISDLQDVLTV